MVSRNWSHELAECVGLWLAEGDHTTIREITFTNNCESLVRLFHRVLSTKFPKSKFRLYAYSPSGYSPLKPKKCFIRQYKDIRANKPYYILRYASTHDVIIWKNLVHRISANSKFGSDILRGFFAGEGNIKTGSHHNRTIRIAQKEPIQVITSILRNLGIVHKFSHRERAYVICGWNNWKKFYEYDIYTLHPDKKRRFLEAWKSYKEIHYPANFIRNNILLHLSNPLTCRQLAIVFKRRPATLQDVLCEMKIEGKVTNYRSGSVDYWVASNSNMIVISKRKAEILETLEFPRKVHEIAEYIDVTWKAARRRLAELEKLGLVKNENYLWHRTPTNKQVIVL